MALGLLLTIEIIGGDTGLETILYPKVVSIGVGVTYLTGELTLTVEIIGVDTGWEVIL